MQPISRKTNLQSPKKSYIEGKCVLIRRNHEPSVSESWKPLFRYNNNERRASIHPTYIQHSE